MIFQIVGGFTAVTGLKLPAKSSVAAATGPLLPPSKVRARDVAAVAASDPDPSYSLPPTDPNYAAPAPVADGYAVPVTPTKPPVSP